MAALLLAAVGSANVKAGIAPVKESIATGSMKNGGRNNKNKITGIEKIGSIERDLDAMVSLSDKCHIMAATRYRI